MLSENPLEILLAGHITDAGYRTLLQAHQTAWEHVQRITDDLASLDRWNNPQDVERRILRADLERQRREAEQALQLACAAILDALPTT